MNRLNDFVIWAAIFIFGLFLLILSFYVAAFLLPIFLALFIFSILANAIFSWYRRNILVKKGGFETSVKKKSNSEIIDAEYEIIDDKK